MNFHFTGRNIEITPALRSFTEEKMQRLQNRHVNISTVHITFLIENVQQIAEATLHVNGADIHASAKAEDLYQAIDLLVDKLLSQITKRKEKMTEHHR